MSAQVEATRGFRFVRGLARLLLRTQYRRVEVGGTEHVPADGPVVIVANHQNSLVDPMVLLHASPRCAAPLAKAPLFKHPLLKRLLEAVRAVPVFRPQDLKENEGRGARANLATFRACGERLKEGGSILLFPEGVSQPQPKLMPIRTGAARIALDVRAPVTIVPAGISFEQSPQRRGTVLALFGPSFVVDGSKFTGRARRGAISETTRHIESSLRDLLAEAESQGDLADMRVLRLVAAQERGEQAEGSLEEELEGTRRVSLGLTTLRAAAPEQVRELRAETDAFRRSLELTGVPLEHLDRPYSLARVLGFAARNLLVLLVGFPLALLAAVVTLPARAAGDVLTLRASRGSEDIWAFSRIAGQSIMVVLLAVCAGVLLGLTVTWWAGLIAFVAVPVLFALLILWRDWLNDASRRVRAFLLLAGGGLRKDLLESRKRLFGLIEQAAVRIEAEESAQE